MTSASVFREVRRSRRVRESVVGGERQIRSGDAVLKSSKRSCVIHICDIVTIRVLSQDHEWHWAVDVFDWNGVIR